MKILSATGDKLRFLPSNVLNVPIVQIYNSLLNMDKAIDNKIKENIDTNILTALIIYPTVVDQNDQINSTIR